jgi:hypothetical protein
MIYFLFAPILLVHASSQLDWKTVPTLKNYRTHDQGQLGTCYAHALTVMVDAVVRKNPEHSSWVSSPLILASYYAAPKIADDPVTRTYKILKSEFRNDTIYNCPASAASKINEGGLLCETFNKLKARSSQLSKWGTAEVLFRPQNGKLPELFLTCQNSLGLIRNKKTVIDCLESGEKDCDIMDYWSSRPGACRTLSEELQKHSFKWQINSVGGVSVKAGTLLNVSACFPVYVANTKHKLSCSGDKRDQLIAFYKLLYGSGIDSKKKREDSFSAFLEAFSEKGSGAKDTISSLRCVDRTFDDVKKLRDGVVKSIDGGTPVGFSFETHLMTKKGIAVKGHGNHGVAIIGYRKDKSGHRYLLRNSWGNPATNSLDHPEIIYDQKTGDLDVPEKLLWDSGLEFQFLE